MQVTRTFRNFFIGKKQFIKSRAEFKRVMLTGYLSLLVVIANWAYMIIDTPDERTSNTVLNIAFCLIGIMSMTLMRFGRHTMAKLLLFIGAYLIIFIFCSLEPFQTGVSIFLVICSVGALALFGFEQRHISFVLSAFGAILFLLAYIFPWKLIEPVAYSADYVFNNFILNFFVSLIISVLILYFMADVNQFSEQSLEKKETEALEKNKELTKLNSELDRFVYSVSHDLRSPLSTIAGLVNIGKYAETVEEAKRYFAMIDDRLKAQDFFIREIIDFYRNSRTEVVHESISLKHEIENIINENSLGENPDSISYQVTIPSDLEFKSDKIRLKSVLSNLIGNAVKYHDLSKKEKFIKIGAERKNGSIEIEVEDNGQGIGSEHLNRIFDMFYRASSDSKGSGLGLFIAQETAGKLGGTIDVHSELTIGTKFSLRIPA